MEKISIFEQEFSKTITEDTIHDLITKVDLDKVYGKESAKKIFKKLDTQNRGSIEAIDFVKIMESISVNDEFYSFFNKIQSRLTTTKSEIILNKLKSVSSILIKKNEHELAEEINYVISSLINDDLTDIEFNDKHFNYEKMSDTMNFVNTFSNRYQSNIMKQNLEKINTINKNSSINTKLRTKRLSTKINMNYSCNDPYRRVNSLANRKGLIDSLGKDSNDIKKSKKTEKIWAKLTKQIGVFGRLGRTLDKISSFEFNIFELNEIVGEKTLHYLSKYVLKDLDFLSDDMLNENKYDLFLDELVEGYDRAVYYHNDLHAGDVFQTVYMMFDNGSLIEVII